MPLMNDPSHAPLIKHWQHLRAGASRGLVRHEGTATRRELDVEAHDMGATPNVAGVAEIGNDLKPHIKAVVVVSAHWESVSDL